MHSTFRLLTQGLLAFVTFTLASSSALAQKGPSGGYSEDFETNALWQSVAASASARTAGSSTNAVRIKVCIGFRRTNLSLGPGTPAARVFLAETENGGIVRPLAESMFPDAADRDGKYSAAAPFWCYFADRERPPTGLVIAEGRSFRDAVPLVYMSGTTKIDFKEQASDADLNRMMFDWVRRR